MTRSEKIARNKKLREYYRNLPRESKKAMPKKAEEPMAEEMKPKKKKETKKKIVKKED